jgi:hypothetical protein
MAAGLGCCGGMAETDEAAMSSPEVPPPDADKDPHYVLWAKYEDIAMHFNDLMLKFRVQVLGGLATLSTLAGYLASGKTSVDPHQSGFAFAFSGVLLFSLVAAFVLDTFYYSRLLKGAVFALRKLESKDPRIKFSTRIESVVGHGTAARARWAFYILIGLPLLGIFVWTLCLLKQPPPPKADVPACLISLSTPVVPSSTSTTTAVPTGAGGELFCSAPP